MQRQRRLAGGFRPVDFDDPAARQAADAERDVEAERARRHRLDLHRLLALEAHDRALAEGPFDLRQGGVERLGLVHARSLPRGQIGLGHGVGPSGMAAQPAQCRSPERTRFVHVCKFFFCSPRQLAGFPRIPEHGSYLQNRAGGALAPRRSARPLRRSARRPGRRLRPFFDRAASARDRGQAFRRGPRPASRQRRGRAARPGAALRTLARRRSLSASLPTLSIADVSRVDPLPLGPDGTHDFEGLVP